MVYVSNSYIYILINVNLYIHYPKNFPLTDKFPRVRGRKDITASRREFPTMPRQSVRPLMPRACYSGYRTALRYAPSCFFHLGIQLLYATLC